MFFFFSQSVKVISQHFFLSFFPICFSIFHHFPVRGASSCCSSCGRPAWRLASSSAAAHWSPAVEPQSGSRVWRSWSWWVARKNGGMMMWNDGYINPCITRILYRYISNQVMSSYSMYTLYIYICIHTYIPLHYITLHYHTYVHTYIHTYTYPPTKHITCLLYNSTQHYTDRTIYTYIYKYVHIYIYTYMHTDVHAFGMYVCMREHMVSCRFFLKIKALRIKKVFL